MAATQRFAVASAGAWPMAATAAVATVVITLPLAIILNIWQDEAFTLHTVSRGVAYAFLEALRFEQSAPLYFVILSLVHGVSGSIWVLRAFSVACAAATAALVPSLARRYAPHVDPALITASIVWNPFFVWAAVEMRPYAMIVLMSAALLRTFYDAFLADRPSRYGRVAYMLVAAVALYAQYYLAFLIVAQAIAIVFYRRERLTAFLACAAVAAVLFIPMLLIVPAQVANFRGPFAPPSFAISTASVGLTIMHYLLPIGAATLAKAVYGVVLLILFAIVYYARRALRRRDAALIPIVLTAACIFVVVTHAAGVLVLNRHVASLYVASLIAVYALLALLERPWRVRASVAWFILTFVISSIGLVQAYAAFAKPGDWIRVNAYIRSNERAGEPIVVFEAENALPFAYYYHGVNSVRPIPNAVDFRRYDVSKFEVDSDAQLDAVFPNTHKAWLITAGDCKAANISFGCDTVERYIARRFSVQSDASFYKSRVRLLQRN